MMTKQFMNGMVLMLTCFKHFPGKSLVLKKESVRLNKNIHFFSKCLLNSMGR